MYYCFLKQEKYFKNVNEYINTERSLNNFVEMTNYCQFHNYFKPLYLLFQKDL